MDAGGRLCCNRGMPATTASAADAGAATPAFSPLYQQIKGLITQGLQAGDKVIVDNLMKLRPGVTVAPSAPQAPAQQPAQAKQ